MHDVIHLFLYNLCNIFKPTKHVKFTKRNLLNYSAFTLIFLFNPSL